MKSRHWGLWAVSLLTVTLLGGCGSTTSKEATKTQQVLRWTESSALATADLAKATDTLSFNVLLNTQEGLYRLDKNQVPQPALATKTTITKNGTVYTFKLRSAKWSNGDPVTAQDFVASWQRTVNPKTASQDAFYLYQVKNAQAVNEGKKPLSSLGIKALNRRTLQVTLTRPVTYFKQLLAWPLFFPINPKVVAQYGSRYGTQARYTVSDGPYRLVGWTGTNKKWQLVKNNQYWDKKQVKLSKISELVTESTDTSYNLFQANKTDETLLSGQQVKNNQHSQNFVKRLPTATTRLDLNQKTVPAFRNLAIRQALSLAIDRQALTQDVLADGSVALRGFVPSNMGKNPTTHEDFAQEAQVKAAVSYNLKKAKVLLAKGFAQAHVTSLNFKIVTSDTDSSKQTAEYLQNALEKLPHVTVSISTIPFVQLIAQQAAGHYQATIKTWQSVFADPINFLDVYESDSSYNTSGWHNTRYDQLLDQAENQDGNSPAKRWAKLVAAEQLLMRDQGTIPLYQVAKSQLLRSTVKGIVYNPAGVPYDFKTATIQ